MMHFTVKILEFGLGECRIVAEEAQKRRTVRCICGTEPQAGKKLAANFSAQIAMLEHEICVRRVGGCKQGLQ